MFKTHYDANDRRPRDGHTLEPDERDRTGKRYAHFDEMEAELMGRVADDLNHDNILYIKGVAYQLGSYGEPSSNGSRTATLHIWKPF